MITSKIINSKSKVKFIRLTNFQNENLKLMGENQELKK